jgi:protein-tyrosine-phosphatase
VSGRILFACEHDTGPSRICAAYFARKAGDRYEVIAAALEPAAGIRPEAASALSEDGIPVIDGPGSELTPELAAYADRIITLGFTLNPEVAPEVPREEWGVPSPAGRPMQEVRVIRDLCSRLVEKLVARLDAEAAVR